MAKNREPGQWPEHLVEEALPDDVVEELLGLIVARVRDGNNLESFREKLMKDRVGPRSFTKYKMVERNERLDPSAPLDVVRLAFGLKAVRVTGAIILQDVANEEDTAIVRQRVGNDGLRLWLTFHDQGVIRFTA